MALRARTAILANMTRRYFSAGSAGTSGSTDKNIVPAPTPGTLKENELKFDEITHTGQAWDQEDYRLVRFTEAPKQVNPNFAIHLIAQVPPTPTKSRIVACDGGGGALGHPKIYINLDKPGNHACGYCGLRFFKEDQPHDDSQHVQV